MKECCNCKESKPATTEFFYSNASHRDGLTSRCKICRDSYDKERYRRKPEKRRECLRKYRVLHIEKLREIQREYRRKNPDYQKMWRKKNLERCRERGRRNYRKKMSVKWGMVLLFGSHRRERSGRTAKYNDATSREASLIYSSLKNRARNNGRIHLTRAEFIEWFNKQKNQCVYCGITEKQSIELQKRLKYKRQKRFGIDRKDSSRGYEVDNLALACDICNSTKGRLISYEEMRRIGEKIIKPKWERILGEKMKKESEA